MPSSRILIASNTLSTSAASVTFSSIPGTYTDLVLKISARTNRAGVPVDICCLQFNGVTTNTYSNTRITAVGSTVNSDRASSSAEVIYFFANAAGSTSNTFANVDIYIPSYTSSSNKPFSSYATPEDNTSDVQYNTVSANLWSNTSSISSILIKSITANSFVTGSTFWLYGLKNS